VESWQKIAPILLQSLVQPPIGQESIEPVDVGSHLSADLDERPPVSSDDASAQRRRKEVQGLREGLSGAPLGKRRPEDGQQFVSLAGTARVSDGQVDEQTEALRLRDYGSGITCGHPHVATAQYEQIDRYLVPRCVHARLRSGYPVVPV
jgi:hypothetical protein